MTLKERCVLFHRCFPDKLIAPMVLCRLYRKHGIRRKVIRKKKCVPFGGEKEREE